MTRTYRRAALAALGVAACLCISLPPSGITSAAGRLAHTAHTAHPAAFGQPYDTSAPLQPFDTVPPKGSLDQFTFRMARSAAAQAAGSACFPHAATVTITRQANNDLMQVQVTGSAPNTGFDLFVIQIPDKPFGVAWYQSDLQTDSTGKGSATVQGIFNAETFSISLGGVAGGSATGATTAVTSTNVAFQPTNQYHLGLWFASPADAQRNGCPATVTPFNGAQNAGIQALSTRNFPAGEGPLSAIRP